MSVAKELEEIRKALEMPDYPRKTGSRKQVLRDHHLSLLKAFKKMKKLQEARNERG